MTVAGKGERRAWRRWDGFRPCAVPPLELEVSTCLITNIKIAVLLAGTLSAESVTYATRMSAVYNPTLFIVFYRAFHWKSK